MKNVIEVFQWAASNGDVNIIDGIVVKVLPELMKEGDMFFRLGGEGFVLQGVAAVSL